MFDITGLVQLLNSSNVNTVILVGVGVELYRVEKQLSYIRGRLKLPQ